MKIVEELVLPALATDLTSRLVSLLIRAYRRRTTGVVEDDLERLRLLLLELHPAVDEGEGRNISSHRLLLWLQGLTQSMYRAYYVLDTFQQGDPRGAGPAKRPRAAGASAEAHRRHYLDAVRNITRQERFARNRSLLILEDAPAAAEFAEAAAVASLPMAHGSKVVVTSGCFLY
ncbi:hypothetical protein E2562_015453 [Oryza meyeriana var. granulata]|uniref:Disease resistance N-terminal domain-containing protein n=1 Tax=Oryza meyeriana var. granulata TaxID=110450 RepID=A0A6G1BW87_9ORYZ|nr:hypothetical protein E2562_015453 [Oryza meyeriana var. granulata]